MKNVINIDKNVYLVKGFKRHAIYDLNNGVLYNISDFVRDIIERLLSSKITSEIADSEEKVIIEYLLSQKIIQLPLPQFNINQNDENISSLFKPDFAWIEITNQCNLRCIHCYEEASGEHTNKIQYEDFLYAVNELKNIGIDRIQLIGGEPMMHHSLKEMIMYCTGKFSFIELFTNATLIDENWANFFRINNINLAISVYSYLSDNHDMVTKVNGSYEKTLHGLKLLKKYQVPYRIACVGMSGISIGEKNTDLFDLSPNPVRLSGRANLNLVDYEIIKKRAITKKNFSQQLDKNLVQSMMHVHNCFSKRLYISTLLEVFPCVMERRFSHGNLKSMRLSDLIKNEIIQFTKDNIETCKDCEYRYACFDCRPDSLNKGLYNKPWYCTYNPYSAEWDAELSEFLSGYKNT